MGARNDFDKMHEWIFTRPTPLRAVFYLFAGSSIGISLIFTLLGLGGYRIFGLINGAILVLFLTDHLSYGRRRGG